MSYSNTWKLGNGASVVISGTTYENAKSITLPNNKIELVDITTLGSSRREYMTGIFDSDSIQVTVPFGVIPNLGATSVVINLPATPATVSFDGILESWAGGTVENGTPVEMILSIKPTTEPEVE